MSLFSELKRRNVLRVAVAYVVTAWLLIQVAETIFPLFGFDDGPARIVVILMAIGFIPALVISWIFELTPSGFRKEDVVDHDLPTATQTLKRFDRVVMLVLVLGISYFAFDKFVLSTGREAAVIENASEDVLRAALDSLRSNKSIAVLPFADMSAEQDQEYFADGITEELLNELAQLEGLNVTGRTSSFAFKGQNRDLREIGKQLGVAYILEGSVRKQNDELRITAQLIDSQNGAHLWSNTYDEQLDDIFAIQEEISRAVAGALSVALDVAGRNHLPGTGTNSVEAYDAFLEAGAARSFEASKVLLDRAIQLDQNYAAAWAALGRNYGAWLSFQLPPAEARIAQEQGRELVVQATKIDPNYAPAYSMLSGYQWARGDWIGATEYQLVYSALAPADIAARMGSLNILGKTGRTREALQIDSVAKQFDPLNFGLLTTIVEHYIQAGKFDDAEAELARGAEMRSDLDQAIALRRMLMAFSQGESSRIRETLQVYARADLRVAAVIDATLQKFDSPAAEMSAELHRIYLEDPELTGEGKLVTASLAIHFGDPEFALEIMSEELRGNLVRVGRIWYPHFREARTLPAFKKLVKDIGFVDYWRKYGWADYCRPLGDTDFKCG